MMYNIFDVRSVEHPWWLYGLKAYLYKSRSMYAFFPIEIHEYFNTPQSTPTFSFSVFMYSFISSLFTIFTKLMNYADKLVFLVSYCYKWAMSRFFSKLYLFNFNTYLAWLRYFRWSAKVLTAVRLYWWHRVHNSL